MSIIVTQLRLPYEADDALAVNEALKKVGLSKKSVLFSGVYKKSLDLRHGKLSSIYSVELSLDSDVKETVICEKDKTVYKKPAFSMPRPSGNKKLSARPLVVGFGPAGMFASLILAENGFMPVVLERGSRLDERDKYVSTFFKTGRLNTSSNIQFGEGGAGAYSDGKLTTRINDPASLLVSELLIKHGAPAETMRSAKPHIGTDLLKNIVISVRKRIEELGGTVLFDSKVYDIICSDGRVKKVVSDKGTFDAETVILAIGHSARDTVEMLIDKGFEITPKSFSVGFRVEHLQSDLNKSVYGRYADKYRLPPAEYLLSTRVNGRGCYSFCMCPGGYVIAAASEEGGVVTNGMSFHSRDGVNANSAVCVSVNADDFKDPLSAVSFQRKLERDAFVNGGGGYAAPVQLAGDFLSGTSGTSPDKIKPTYPRGYALTDFSKWMPSFITETVKASFGDFAGKISCFSDKSAVLTGVESRTSSPVRILRDDNYNSTFAKGLIPCGEGAGYAGGIMSAAVDGIRAANAVLSVYGGF